MQNKASSLDSSWMCHVMIMIGFNKTSCQLPFQFRLKANCRCVFGSVEESAPISILNFAENRSLISSSVHIDNLIQPAYGSRCFKTS